MTRTKLYSELFNRYNRERRQFFLDCIMYKLYLPHNNESLVSKHKKLKFLLSKQQIQTIHNTVTK